MAIHQNCLTLLIVLTCLNPVAAAADRESHSSPTVHTILQKSAGVPHGTDLPPTLKSSLVQELVARHGPRMVRSRYMEKNCEPVNWPGWEGLPVLKCRYPVTDRATSTTKFAEVILLNPDPERVARWVVTAVTDAKSTQPARDADHLYRHIIQQSGGQFPIAGVVYEDMEGDGMMKAYCFRNGVTVRVSGIDHRTTKPLNQAEITASLRGPVERVYTYARIASTTPDQYKAAGGTAEVGTNTHRRHEWLEVVADLYRRAWHSDRNELISAWTISLKK